MREISLKTVIAAVMVILILTVGFTAPGMRSARGEEDGIRIELVVDVRDIYSVYYTAYLKDERACSGGAADLDGNELEEGRVLKYVIPKALLGDDADLSGFSIDFSPFGRESSYELGRTNAVAFPAEEGVTYRIHLIQMEEDYIAVPEWEDEIGQDEGEKFSIEIGGDVMPDEVDYSYLRVDYYLGETQCGYLYTCADEGKDVILIDFPKEVFEGIADEPDLTDFRAELYLSYSDLRGDEAVLQAMYGNTGTDEYLTDLRLSAEYGQTYRYVLSGDHLSGYTLREVEE